MTKLWAITANAFLQTIRQPMYMILLLVTFAVLVVSVPLTGYSMDMDATAGDVRLLVDFGMSTVMIGGLFIAAFSAAGVLTREIDQKTVLTVVSKPVPRPLILLGKFLGVAAAVTIATYLMSIVFLLTVRHGVVTRASTPVDPVVITFGVGALLLTAGATMFCSYFFGWQVASTSVTLGAILFTIAGAAAGMLDYQWGPTSFGEKIDPQIPIVLSLIWMALMLMTALAVAISTRLSQMATLLVCVGVFALSLVSEALFRPAAGENPLARLAYWVIPNMAYFFNLDALTMGKTIGGGYVALGAAYAGCYVVALLALGMALFQTREMDARRSGSMAPMLVNLFAWYLRIAAVAIGIAGLSMLSRATQQEGVLIGAAMIVGSGFAWLVAGSLGRGRRWALIVLWLITAALHVGSVVCLVFLWPNLIDLLARTAVVGLTGVQVVYVAVMSLRRPTRAHFGMLTKS